MFKWSVTFKTANTDKQTVVCEGVSKKEAFAKIVELKRFPDITAIRTIVRKDAAYHGDITWTRSKKLTDWREVAHL